MTTVTDARTKAGEKQWQQQLGGQRQKNAQRPAHSLQRSPSHHQPALHLVPDADPDAGRTMSTGSPFRAHPMSSSGSTTAAPGALRIPNATFGITIRSNSRTTPARNIGSTAGGRQPAQRIDTIKIRGSEPFYDTVVTTVFGPVMFDPAFTGYSDVASNRSLCRALEACRPFG